MVDVYRFRNGDSMGEDTRLSEHYIAGIQRITDVAPQLAQLLRHRRNKHTNNRTQPLLLSPLCIISSSLYEWALHLTINIDEQTLLLIMILILVWGISAFSIFDLIRGRSFRTLFFY